MDIKKIKQLASEMLYENETFMDELREKYGEEGMNIMQNLEKSILKKVEKIDTSLGDDRIRDEIYKILVVLKKKLL
ncbi:hypothetical protein J7L48_03180 [bacterium]|nr:hypothetical protein [bacterium]